MTQNRQTSTVDIDGLNDSAFKVRLRRNIEILQSVLANPTTVIGMVIVVSLLLMALLAPIITEPNMPDPYQMPRDWKAARSAPLTPGHVLGTTNRGGDVFYGVVWGARTSLKLSLIVVCLTVVVGVTIGSIAGIVGGKVDEILMRIVDVFLSIPELICKLITSSAALMKSCSSLSFVFSWYLVKFSVTRSEFIAPSFLAASNQSSIGR